MKYYSEKLKKLFDTVEELKEAEKQFDEKEALELKKREERAARAKEVDEAYQHYTELMKKFIEDYGYYHKTYNDKNFIDLIDNLWRWPF